MTFRAVRADKTDAGQSVRFVEMDESELMDGDVTVRVTHSTVNYKDGLALSGKSPIIRRFPMVLGVDLAGIVESARRQDFAPGDEVVLTGYGLSETHFGGYAERARVNGDWLVKLPSGLTRAEAMAIGTAGFTAMLSLMAIERHGLEPSAGPALVTGAAGGVGSMAISLLAAKGWRVIGSTGRQAEAPYLEALGADEVIDRATLSTPSDRPLGKEQWAAAVDSVGSTTLANVLAQTRYGGLRACGGHGPARVGRAVHPARRLASRDRQRPVPGAAPARGLAALGARSRPRQAREDDPDDPLGRGVRGRRPHP
jgi:acrylyl-CoA reductase (NADPH)